MALRLRTICRLLTAEHVGTKWSRQLYTSVTRLSRDEGRREHKMDESELNAIPRQTDVVIIGGGAIGMSAAFWLKQLAGNSLSVTLIERDFTYSRAATTLSAGGIRQQFSIPENISMSVFSAEFLRNAKRHLSVLGLDPPDVNFNIQGYLYLASEQGLRTMEDNFRTQISAGAKVELLSGARLTDKFLWLNTEGVSLACYGYDNEGWFDPWLLLSAFRKKAASLGVHFVSGNASGFRSTGNNSLLNEVLVSSHGGSQTNAIRFGRCVNCGGPWSGEVARLAGIGSGTGALAVKMPVEPRKRFVYMVHCPNGPGLQMPMLVDTSGVYIRREGTAGHYICGASPPPGMPEPDTSNLDVDYEFFNDFVWPNLAQRVPSFEALKLKSAWAGFYDFNYFDCNLFIGPHPAMPNFFLANGCSGHGIMHSPAIGRAVAELLTHGHYETIDLSRMSFDRVIRNEPLLERNVV